MRLVITYNKGGIKYRNLSMTNKVIKSDIYLPCGHKMCSAYDSIGMVYVLNCEQGFVDGHICYCCNECLLKCKRNDGRGDVFVITMSQLYSWGNEAYKKMIKLRTPVCN